MRHTSAGKIYSRYITPSIPTLQIALTCIPKLKSNHLLVYLELFTLIISGIKLNPS